MNFLKHWDKRIEANKELFDKHPQFANICYDEALLAFYAGKEQGKEEAATKVDLVTWADVALHGQKILKEIAAAIRMR